MAKDPAFLFYPGDWLGGTMTLTRAHKGAYMDLHMAQFNQGHLSPDDIRFVLGSDYDSMWETKLKDKFSVDSDGKYFNEKLDFEVVKRKKFTDSRLNNLLKEEKHIRSHMDPQVSSHMENENRNENKKVKKKKPFVPPTKDQVVLYFTENGYSKERAEKAFNHYNIADWHDAK